MLSALHRSRATHADIYCFSLYVVDAEKSESLLICHSNVPAAQNRTYHKDAHAASHPNNSKLKTFRVNRAIPLPFRIYSGPLRTPTPSLSECDVFSLFTVPQLDRPKALLMASMSPKNDAISLASKKSPRNAVSDRMRDTFWCQKRLYTVFFEE